MGNKLQLKFINNIIEEYKYALRGFSKLYVSVKAVELFYDVSSFHEYKDYCEHLYDTCNIIKNLCNEYTIKTNNTNDKINKKLNAEFIRTTKGVMYDENLFVSVIRAGLNMDALESTYMPNYRNEKVYIPVAVNPFAELVCEKLNINEGYDLIINYFEDYKFHKHSKNISLLNECLQNEVESLSLKNNDNVKSFEETIEDCKEKNTELYCNLLDYENLKTTIRKQFKNVQKSCDISNKLINDVKENKITCNHAQDKFVKMRNIRDVSVENLYDLEFDYFIDKTQELKSPTEWSVPLELKK